MSGNYIMRQKQKPIWNRCSRCRPIHSKSGNQKDIQYNINHCCWTCSCSNYFRLFMIKFKIHRKLVHENKIYTDQQWRNNPHTWPILIIRENIAYLSWNQQKSTRYHRKKFKVILTLYLQLIIRVLIQIIIIEWTPGCVQSC